jgi:hypothetical protein
MRVQYPYGSSSPRAFLKAHQVLAALTAAVVVTAAVGVSLGAWQLRGDSSDNATASAPAVRIATVDELIAMNEAALEPHFGASGAPSVRIATVDELIAMNESALEPHFGAAPAAEIVVPSASTDELLAIHEALTSAQFGDERLTPANDGPAYPPSREGVRGPVTV